MKKKVIGYIHYDKKPGYEERYFTRLAKEYNVKLVRFNLYNELDERKIEKRAKECDIIFNNSAEEFTIEFVKTLEGLGKKVIDSSKSYYYFEDKWIFFLKCKKLRIKVPDTILLSEDLNLIRSELERFKYWPVIIKRVFGTTGDFVDKADNCEQAIMVIKKFRKKAGKSPIIAQEFIKSHCYRVTVIDKKIVQAIKKNSKGWKETGNYAKDSSIEKIFVDKNMKKLIDRLMGFIDIKVCGIDLLKKDSEWVVIEVNSQPAFDFIKKEKKELIKKVFNLLMKETKNSKQGH